MRTELFDLSRGDIFRAVLGKGPSELPEDTKIEDSVKGLMKRVEGAELCSDRDHSAPGPMGQVGDQYCATYNISPEGITLEIAAVIGVKIYGTGPKDNLEAAYRRIDAALKQKPEPAATED